MDALIWLTIGITIVAMALSFIWVEDADAPMGDGMIIGCLLLVFPLWPITMPLWLLYILKRHSDADAWRGRR